MSAEDTVREMEAFRKRGWWLNPSSYQIRQPDGEPGGWIAQVHVFHETYRETTILPLLEVETRVYDTAEEANAVAVRMGYAWLTTNAA